MDYWNLYGKTTKLAQNNYEAHKDIFDPAIKAWDQFNLLSNYHNFYHDATIFLTYKLHMDKALKRAITSCLSLDYDQAIYNLRLAVENAGIVVFAFGNNMAAEQIFKEGKNPKFDNKIRTGSINYLKTALPDFSSKLKDLHSMADDFGSHQTIAVHGNYLSFDDDKNNARITPSGNFNLELTVGICGIVMGILLEVHEAMKSLPTPKWIKVEKSSYAKLGELRNELVRMQNKYKPLFFETVLKSELNK